MEALETLAVALGFASLAGVNLYLTVFVTGLAVNQQWIDLSQQYPELMVLGEPVVLIAAGALAAIEFFSDKIPWVDSAWDSVHTFIRPVGGGLLALTALGPVDPALAVVIAMLAGGTSLMTHGLKAGTRLAINQSPEPVSNMAASMTEDMAVVGGLALMSINPLVFAAICILFIIVSLIAAPKLFRRTRTFAWLFRAKAGSLFHRKQSGELLKQQIAVEDEVALNRFVDGKPEVTWSVPVVLGGKWKFPGLTANTFGRIYALDIDAGQVHFIGKKGWKLYHAKINLDDLYIRQETRFASEDVILENPGNGKKLVLRLPSGSENVAARVVAELTAARIKHPPAYADKPSTQLLPAT
ncbi:MAG: DUF4126 domain-containing protein [Verrucomicrobiales bacterium]|nr:DUF4126 domain-containing protein [Verrucomicrobiales bacterium]